jgi:hypothetical protein
LSFDPFPFDQNGLAPPELDVGGRQVGDALVISQVIVVSDEGLDLGFEIAWQVIVLVAISMDGKVMARQCLRRAALAIRQIRGGVSQSLRVSRGGSRLDRQLSSLL